MKQKLIHTVVTDMLSYLNNAQVEKLKEVLLHTLWDYDIVLPMARPRSRSKTF